MRGMLVTEDFDNTFIQLWRDLMVAASKYIMFGLKSFNLIDNHAQTI